MCVCVCAGYLSSSAVQTTEGRGSLGEEVEVERRLQLCLSVNSEQERVRGGGSGVFKRCVAAFTQAREA